MFIVTDEIKKRRRRRSVFYFLNADITENTHLLIFLFFICYLPSPNVRITTPGTYNPFVSGSDACRKAYFEPEHQTNTQEQTTLKYVVSRMSGPLQRTIHFLNLKNRPYSPRISSGLVSIFPSFFSSFFLKLFLFICFPAY